MEEDKKDFSQITEIQKRKIIRIVSIALLQARIKAEKQFQSESKTSSENERKEAEIYNKLFDTKEIMKKNVYELDLQVNKVEEKAKLKMEFADFICNYIMKNINRYSNMSIKNAQDLILQDMEYDDILTPSVLIAMEDKRNKTGQPEYSPQKTGNVGKIINMQNQNLKKSPNTIQQRSGAEQKVIDISKLNKPELLLTNRRNGKKEIKYGRYSPEKQKANKFNYQEKEIQLTRTGRLAYKTPFMLEADIDEYKLKTIAGESTIYTYGLNIEKLTNDEQYRKIFFERLISYKNLYWINRNGYIGDIVEDTESANKYKIEYSAERYTAIEELKNRLAKSNNRRVADNKEDR